MTLLSFFFFNLSVSYLSGLPNWDISGTGHNVPASWLPLSLMFALGRRDFCVNCIMVCKASGRNQSSVNLSVLLLLELKLLRLMLLFRHCNISFPLFSTVTRLFAAQIFSLFISMDFQ